jgi:hypothetical protein
MTTAMPYYAHGLIVGFSMLCFIPFQPIGRLHCSCLNCKSGHLNVVIGQNNLEKNSPGHQRHTTLAGLDMTISSLISML